jgi:hypothetical protein
VVRRSLESIALAARLTRDLPGFLRTPIASKDATAVVRRRLAGREDGFLHLLETAVYAHQSSPYLRLLQAAGCELGDLRSMVFSEGVEGTLSRLVDQGVYVTPDEFKGRAEAVRGSQRFRFEQKDFDNPLVSPDFELVTGGSQSPGSPVKAGLGFAADLAANTAVAHRVHGLSDHDHAYWLLSTAFTLSLRMAKLGRPPIAWFYPLRPASLKLRLGSRYLALVSRLSGSRLPVPGFIDLRSPERMAAWLHRRVEETGPVCLTCYGSSAVRISVAAGEAGLPLDDVCFVAFGEPITETKRRAIESSGARAVVHYGFTEGGMVGYSCATPRVSDDVHLFSDSYGLVQRSRAVGDSVVGSFALTSLLSSTPKILLNTELGDHGVVENRACGCGFDHLGLSRHLSHIRSFEKMSGEGMTFARTELLHVIEDVLPSRFGGKPGDYQVIEEEDQEGVLRMALRVNPGIGPIDEGAMARTFLEELARPGGYAPIGTGIWRQAGTLQIRREPPLATRAGKVLPFQSGDGPATRSGDKE